MQVLHLALSYGIHAIKSLYKAFEFQSGCWCIGKWFDSVLGLVKYQISIYLMNHWCFRGSIDDIHYTRADGKSWNVSWIQASLACAARSAQLPEISSFEDLSILLDFLRLYRKEDSTSIFVASAQVSSNFCKHEFRHMCETKVREFLIFMPTICCISAYYRLCDMPMLWTWDRLLWLLRPNLGNQVVIQWYPESIPDQQLERCPYLSN